VRVSVLRGLRVFSAPSVLNLFPAFAALLLCCAAFPAAAQGLPNLAALEGRGGIVSGLVVDLDRGRVVAELAPDRQVAPASVTKLVSGALALETWGPEHGFVTRLAAAAPPLDGVVQGDLVLQGGGDPALTDEGLWRLARDLVQAGVRRVSGDLVIDASRFGYVPCSTSDRCNALDRSWSSYEAPLSSAGVNFSSLAVRIRPAAEAGQPALVLPDPFHLPSVELLGAPVTREGGGIEVQLQRDTLPSGERLTVEGGLPRHAGPLEMRRSVGHPERLTGELLRGFLQREGVVIDGGLRFAYTPETAPSVLAERSGRRLGEVLQGMMYYSTNFSADVLSLELARAAGFPAPVELPTAGSLLAAYLREALLRSRFRAGAEPHASLRDGSGLDSDNRLSARELVALLDRLYLQPDLFPTFLGSLVVPAHGRGRSLRGDDPEWAASVAGKTGGLSQPVSVTTFAGYLRFADGGWGAFAFLVNGSPGRPIPRVEAFEAMRRDFAALRSAARP